MKKKTITKILSALLTVVMLLSAVPLSGLAGFDLFSVFASAANIVKTGKCGDNVTYTLDSDGKLVISGTGEMKDYDYDRSPFYYNNNIKTVTIETGVVSIGDMVFNNCRSLTSITIPNSVTRIGDYAFFYCTGLTSITIPDSVKNIGGDAFERCESLTNVTIPNSVTRIGEEAFEYCENLASISIGNNVTSIETNAFYDTAYYNDSSNWENNVLYLGEYLIKAKSSITGSYEIKPGTKVIADAAFAGCDELTSVTIPGSVKNIGWDSFEDCYGLTKVNYTGTIDQWCNISFGSESSNPVCFSRNLYINDELLTTLNIPDTVIAIGKFAFMGCSSLTSITIPGSVTSIGFCAFCGCDKLTSITIPNSVTSIGFNAFYYCENLASISIGNNVTSIGAYAFYDTAYYNDSSNWENDCLYLGDYLIQADDSITGSYEIKPGTKVIADVAFAGCDELTGVTIPDSVTIIGDEAFEDCENLASISIGNNVTSIGYNAFCEIAYFNDSINLENDCLYLGDYLIRADDSITGSYEIKPGTKIVSGGAFVGCDGLTSVIIPDSVKNIGKFAFGGCRNLTCVTIGNGVAGIEDIAFAECEKLTRITIPTSVTSIGKYAFGYDEFEMDDINYIYSAQQIPNFFITCYANTAGEKYAIDNDFDYELICIHNWSKWTITKAATCTEEGVQTRTCPLCRRSETQTITATGHTVVVDNAVAPTCTKTGLTEGSHCSVCDSVITAQEAVPSIGHTVVIDHATEPNCTATGLTEGSHCSVCDAVITAQVIIPAIGHTFGEWETILQATCTTNGSKIRICSECLHVESESILSTGHTFGAWTVVSPATTEKEGLEERTCHCGEKETRSIPKLTTEKVVSVKLNTNKVDTNYNRTFTLTPTVEVEGNPEYIVEYTSSNPKVATVDQNGNVKTTGKGNATITVTVTDSNGNVVTDTCNVNVKFNFGQWLLYIICFGWIWM